MMQDTKSVVAQLRGYLRGERGAPSGYEDLSVYDALALYFSLIRNDFQDAMQERSEVESVLREVYEEHKGSALADKALQFLIGYKMIYVDWAEAEALCEQALTELSQAVQPDLLATLISLELRLGKFGEASQHFETYVSTYPQEEAEIQSLRESFVTAESDYELGWKRGLPKPGVSSPETSAALATVPATFGLAQNFPNPFNPETTIRFSLGEREHVRLVIFDIAGQRVCTLYEGELAAGAQTLTWNGRNQNGMAVASGVYLYELSVGDRVERKKMMLVR